MLICRFEWSLGLVSVSAEVGIKVGKGEAFPAMAERSSTVLRTGP